jgi:hypothetical protein
MWRRIPKLVQAGLELGREDMSFTVGWISKVNGVWFNAHYCQFETLVYWAEKIMEDTVVIGPKQPISLLARRIPKLLKDGYGLNCSYSLYQSAYCKSESLDDLLLQIGERT